MNTRAAEALRAAGAGGVAASAVVASAPPANSPAASPASGAELEGLFWQSIIDSTNPADFEAYLRRFPTGVFSELAQNRLGAMRGAAGSVSQVAAPSAAGIGASVSGSPVSGAPARTPGSAVGGDARSRPGAAFRRAQTCVGQPSGTACWQEISHQPGCYVWNPYRQPDSTVTWTEECTGGLAQGTGTLSWAWNGNRESVTGRMMDGQLDGHSIVRESDGAVAEGPYVNGGRNGHWVWRYPDGHDGEQAEGSFVDSEFVGTWVIRLRNGTVEEWLFRDGERVR